MNCHFICEKIQQKLVFTGYVKIGEQLGHILIKASDEERINHLCNQPGIIDIFAPV